MGREAKGFNPFKEGGAQKVSPSLEGGAQKVSDQQFTYFVAPLPVINDHSLNITVLESIYIDQCTIMYTVIGHK